MTKALAINIGNTNTSFGLFNDKTLIKNFSAPTSGYKKGLIAGLFKKKPDQVIIASVVPRAKAKLKKLLKNLYTGKIFIVGENICVPIKNKYQTPDKLGSDRLVNAFAASRLYKAPLVVVDFGTAITFNVVSKQKEFLGGMIFPGINASLSSLKQSTALLPQIKLSHPKKLIGRNTKECIKSGVIYGIAGLTDRLIEKIEETLKQKLTVIATGGQSRLIKPYSKKVQYLDANLNLKGLRLILGDKL
ncbi:MAG: type III pantothenate kinase [Candidatus Omnitrophica bacterium]|jgi:type III pantothenate kinase|nr:type III pantothenate kinase [Candidatus Omnitrophota bacterium]